MKTIETFEQSRGFRCIGEYHLTEQGGVRRSARVKITQRVALVYAIVSDDDVRYIGTSVQGYSRPLGYHKNEVMTDVRDGIVAELRAGRRVTVWARTERLHVDHDGLRLNVIDAIEMALIKQYRPTWNNQVHED